MTDGRVVALWAMLASLLWLLALAGLVATWAVSMEGFDRWGRPVAVTTVVVSAVAVAVTCRCYAARVCKLIRIVHGFDAETAAGELHAVR